MSEPAGTGSYWSGGESAAEPSAELDRTAGAAALAGVDTPTLKESDILTHGVSLRVTEQGDGPVVLFCHGFPE
jgi:hypothetical protein